RLSGNGGSLAFHVVDLAGRHLGDLETPGQVDHMESEGASVPGKAADGSAREVRIVARGVELRRGS
ncbi:MAG: hypothetical protein AAFX94_05715, partial [Myxococcota bacterium]